MADTYGRDRYVAADVYRQIFKNGHLDIMKSRNRSLTGPFLDKLSAGIWIPPARIVEEKYEDSLLKFVTRLEDDQTIETVVIPMISHNTLCISSQVGCRMGCRFCETASLGFRRNLTTAEITGQVFTARFHYGYDIRNIVFMGMGEPLDNFDNVVQAIRVLTDPRGFDIAMSHITLSTAGLTDKIGQLAELNWPLLHLAISLNAPNDRIRSLIMPINQAHPMEKIRETLLTYPLSRSFSFYIEYVVIKGINDSEENAFELVDFLSPLPVWFNLIPYNKGSDKGFSPTTEDDMDRFRDYLISQKAFVRKRSTRGKSIMGACGQLGHSRLDPVIF